MEDGFAFLSTPNIKGREIDFVNVNFIGLDRYEESPEIKLSVGDVLLAKDGSTLGTVNVVRSLPRPTTVNSSIAVISPGPNLDGTYLRYLFQSSYMEQTIQRIKGGMGVPHLFQEDLNKFYVPLADLNTQTAIAAFLDSETAKIDALVEEQKRLVELLNEKRQVVISRAVTKGIDPDAPMKNSGVEWLGDVPQHWSILRIKFISMGMEQGWSPQCEPYPVASPDEWGVLKVGCVNGGTFNENENKALPMELAPLPHLTLRKDDLLISRANTRELVGSAAVVEDDFPRLMLCDKLFRLKLSDTHCIPKFISYFLGTAGAKKQVELRATGASNSMLNIAQSTILELAISLPPIDEQPSIVSWIEEKIAKLRQLETEAYNSIALLLERRSAIISAAVTGKVDVRRDPIDTGQIANRLRMRLLIGATIIEAIASKPNSGRTKAHKLVYLAEAHAGVHELEGTYLREAAGPLDRDMIDEIETQLQEANHIAVEQPGGPGSQVIYKIYGQRGSFRTEVREILGPREAVFNKLITDLMDLDTKRVEAVATLYAVWNDALIAKDNPTDAAIVSGVLNDWHPEKKEKFRADELHTWLGWMRRHGLVPRGNGVKTSTGRLFV